MLLAYPIKNLLKTGLGTRLACRDMHGLKAFHVGKSGLQGFGTLV
jgi:hypothetical protein